MAMKRPHPYIPNSVKEVQQGMLKEVGAEKMADLYTYIPEHLKFEGKLDLPDPLPSEIELRRHVEGILNTNISTAEYSSFLGGGCYRHFVPAACDEINSRSEFLTAYCGETYSDHGKVQAIFEYTSLIGELVEMDVVGLATYDQGQAVSTSVNMTQRITQRKRFLIPANMNPDVKSQMVRYCKDLEMVEIGSDLTTGEINLEELKSNLREDVAGVLIENPSYEGVLETKGQEIADLVHEVGGLFVVSCDPGSLGIIETPANYGADVCCGEIQGLGMHMGFGSGLAGFIAAHDKPEFIMNFPNHFYALYENTKGEFGFSRSLNSRTSYGSREDAIEYLGTNAGLWAITAAVYLSVMGPEGMRELGENIMLKTRYATNKFSKIPYVSLQYPEAHYYREFVLDFSKAEVSSSEICSFLLENKIFAGVALTEEQILLCVTEMNTKEEIDRLVKLMADYVEERRAK